MAGIGGDAVERLLELSYSDDVKLRAKAAGELCPCRVKANDERVWERLLELSGDPDRTVRSRVLHNLTDGAPRGLHERVVVAIERMQQDPDEKLRKNARRMMARYRRTGSLNQHD